METRFSKNTAGVNDKVFVGSIPGYFREEDIRAVFEPYGYVASVKINFKADNPNLNRGFCILTMRNPAVAARLIHTKQIHIGNGRFVICKPYLHGQQLQEEIVRHDLRRVILKQLPAEIGEEEIKESLEAMVGPVEVVFVFESDERIPTSALVRRVRTASVTFFSPEDAQRIFERPDIYEIYILLQGKPIKVQRFRYQPPMNESNQPISEQTVARTQEPQFPIVRLRPSLINSRVTNPPHSMHSQNGHASWHKVTSNMILDHQNHSESNLRFNKHRRPAGVTSSFVRKYKSAETMHSKHFKKTADPIQIDNKQ
jgi:RNA recognition motif-containing protein